jgi:hypothetical protein
MPSPNVKQIHSLRTEELYLMNAELSLSLRELHELLNQRGINVSYSVLSSFLNFDKDIANLLGVSGGKNLRKVPAQSVDILAAFWPLYQEAGGQKPKAYALLRRVMDSGSLVRQTAELAPIEPGSLVRGTEEQRGRAEGLAREDEVFTAEEASAFLRVTQRQLRAYVKPSFRIGKSSRGDRWRKSDLLSL